MALGYAPRRTRGKQGIGIMGLLGLGESPPTRIQGVAQRAAYTRPLRCDKCGSSEIFSDVSTPRRIFCHGCHSDWFLLGRID